MENKMENKILEAIRENLPEKEVGIVRKVFEERDIYKKQSEELEKENKDLKDRLQDYIDDSSNFKEKSRLLNEEKDAFKEREKEILEKERKQNEEIAKTKYNVMERCFNIVLGNTVVRKNIQKSIPVPGQYGVTYENESSNEEKKEEMEIF